MLHWIRTMYAATPFASECFQFDTKYDAQSVLRNLCNRAAAHGFSVDTSGPAPIGNLFAIRVMSFVDMRSGCVRSVCEITIAPNEVLTRVHLRIRTHPVDYTLFLIVSIALLALIVGSVAMQYLTVIPFIVAMELIIVHKQILLLRQVPDDLSILVRKWIEDVHRRPIRVICR